ncbi:MAG: RNA polymerase sigma factor [Planctomycetota bacterium]|jgi:RNA polymerase sigma-70 factor (ECF subfamily)
MKRQKIRSSRAHPDEETRLICRFQQGDPAAFAELYEQYLPAITAYLRRTNDNRISSEDLAQEVFARIWQGRKRFRRDSNFATYAISIAKNVLREEQRSRRQKGSGHENTERASDIPSAAVGPLAVLAYWELLDATEQVKSALSEKQRQALELMISSDISAKKAAEQVGCSYDAFRQRLRDARRHLAQMLKKSGWS